jgi:hypothetical protein
MGLGPLDALKENWCEGIFFKASLMIGDMVNDEVGWLFFGIDWLMIELSGTFKVSNGWFFDTG